MIQETKSGLTEMMSIQQACFKKQYSHVATVAMGIAGGIAAFWKDSRFQLINSFSSRHALTTILQIIGTKEQISITNVYGPHTVHDRIAWLKHLTSFLQPLNHKYQLLAGDFNIILNLGEKRGGLRRLDSDSQAFQDLIDDKGFIDIPTKNGIHT